MSKFLNFQFQPDLNVLPGENCPSSYMSSAYFKIIITKITKTNRIIKQMQHILRFIINNQNQIIVSVML